MKYLKDYFNRNADALGTLHAAAGRCLKMEEKYFTSRAGVLSDDEKSLSQQIQERAARMIRSEGDSACVVAGLMQPASSIMERRTEQERSLESIFAAKTGKRKPGKGRTDSTVDVSCANPAVQCLPRGPRARPPPSIGTTSALASTPLGTTPVDVPLASPLPTEPSPMEKHRNLMYSGQS